MANLTKRATVYFEPKIHRLLKVKAAETSSSISEIINRLLNQEFLEDAEDIKVFESRAKEPAVTYESLLKELKDEGRI
jgi:hypothetical protein